MKRYALTMFLLMALAGCGSSGSNTNGGVNPVVDAVIASFAGIWDFTTTENDLIDEVYSVFGADGSITDYDYLGDSFDGGPNCYVVRNAGVIVSMGEGLFSIIDVPLIGRIDNVRLTLSEGELIFDTTQVTSSNPDITLDDTGVDRFPRADLQQSDFTPLCDTSSISSAQKSAVFTSFVFK